MKPDTKTYEAAMKLLTPEMKPILDWLEAERSEVMELMSTAKAENMQVMQGQAQGLKRILEVIRMSRDILEKSKG